MRRDELLRRRDEIKAIAARPGAVNVRVFGSVARDEARPDSDVDFLVTMTEHTSSWFPAKLELNLEEALQTPEQRTANTRRQIADMLYESDQVLHHPVQVPHTTAVEQTH